jgi:hypothetical protein
MTKALRGPNRQFVIAVEDYGEIIILPRLLDRLFKVALHIRIKIFVPNPVRNSRPRRAMATSTWCQRL